jgi:hypothetical protein
MRTPQAVFRASHILRRFSVKDFRKKEMPYQHRWVYRTVHYYILFNDALSTHSAIYRPMSGRP